MPILNTARLPALKPENIKAGVNVSGIMGTYSPSLAGVGTTNYDAGGRAFTYLKTGNFYFFNETTAWWPGDGPLVFLSDTNTRSKIATDLGKSIVSYRETSYRNGGSNATFGWWYWNGTSWASIQATGYAEGKIITMIEMI